MGERNRHPKRDIAARQARVGIIANPKSVAMPRHAPRDIWTRWPRLRSNRRLVQTATDTAQDKPPADLILSGEALQSFARDLRSKDLAPPDEDVPRPSLGERATEIMRRNPLRWLALGIVGIAAVVLAFSVLGA